jgi:hypothetical protein
MCRHVLLGIIAGFCVVGAMENATLAATSLVETKTDVDRGEIKLERGPTEVVKERVPSGNPLWAIPLGSLSITNERPIFTPSRRPPAPAIVAVPRVEPVKKIVAPPVVPEHPNLALIGTVVGDAEAIGVFLDQSTQQLVRLKTGEGRAGWILRSVKTREATLEKGSQTETLRLPATEAGEPRSSDRSNPQ